MAAVKSQAGPGAMQAVSGQKMDGLVRRCVRGRADAQKHQQSSILPSLTGLVDVWPGDLERANTVLFLQSSSVHLPYRSPESVMDEITAAMVLTNLSCSPVILSPTLSEPHGPLDVECGGGELSDSGSSGYWSWGRSRVSPAASLYITESDSSTGQLTDEELHTKLTLGPRAETSGRRRRRTSRGAYRCLWPGCGKLLTSQAGMTRHIRILHLGGPEQSPREEDFYYTEVFSEEEEPTPLSPPLLFHSEPWPSCSSSHSHPTASKAQSSSSALSQSAPGSVCQIHTEHLYQACAPIEMTPFQDFASCSDWTSAEHQLRPQMSVSRSRSVSVGEQWLQRNKVPTISTSPARIHCSIRKGRGEAKKCRKVYGVERRGQWCTACRWKKACQRFPD